MEKNKEPDLEEEEEGNVEEDEAHHEVQDNNEEEKMIGTTADEDDGNGTGQGEEILEAFEKELCQLIQEIKIQRVGNSRVAG